MGDHGRRPAAASSFPSLTYTHTFQANEKDYPFKAGSLESAQQWVETLKKLQKNTKFREKRGSVADATAAADAAAAHSADTAATATAELTRDS